MDLKKPYLIGAVILFILNFADIILTYSAISAGASELNPISAFLIGSGLLIPFKIFFGVLILLGALRAASIKLINYTILWLIVGIYSLTIVLNIVTLLRLT